MPTLYGPPWGPAGRRRPAANPNLRVSDADRSAVADQLSKHYADGRLNSDEFNQRMEQAMNAKTQGDLSGLLDDLPAAEEPAGAEPAGRPRSPLRVLAIICLIVFAAVAFHGLAHPFFVPFFFIPFPWLLAGVLVFLWLRHRRRYGDPGAR